MAGRNGDLPSLQPPGHDAMYDNILRIPYATMLIQVKQAWGGCLASCPHQSVGKGSPAGVLLRTGVSPGASARPGPWDSRLWCCPRPGRSRGSCRRGGQRCCRAD